MLFTDTVLGVTMAAGLATWGRSAALARLVTAVLAVLAAGLGSLVLAPQAALAESPAVTSVVA